MCDSVMILVDADAMPKQAMAICRTLAAQYSCNLTTVSSIRHELVGDNHVTVDASPQAADMEIVRRVRSGVRTLVITQDYGLAALILGKGAKCLSPTGREYTNENIDLLLAERAIHGHLRRTKKMKIRGPKARSMDDDRRFEENLRRILRDLQSKMD